MVEDYINWVHSVQKNLVMTKKGPGRKLMQAIERLGRPSGLLMCVRHSEGLTRLLRASERPWTQRFGRKAENWTRVLRYRLLQDGIGTEELVDGLMRGDIKLSEAVRLWR